MPVNESRTWVLLQAFYAEAQGLPQAFFDNEFRCFPQIVGGTDEEPTYTDRTPENTTYVEGFAVCPAHKGTEMRITLPVSDEDVEFIIFGWRNMSEAELTAVIGVPPHDYPTVHSLPSINQLITNASES